MILPSHDRRLAARAAWARGHTMLVRARFLLAGVYLVALGAAIWAMFFNDALLTLHFNSDFLTVGIISLVFFAMQVLLLAGAPHFRWPRPTRRRWMYVSLAAGALMAGLLTFGLFAAITTAVHQRLEWLGGLGSGWVIVVVVIGFPWAFWFGVFGLLWVGQWLSLFRRMYRLLVAGTILELLVTIPADIAVRKRTQCYCDEGTFWSLIIGITMAFWTFGPGIVLLFFDVRDQLQEGICLQCGYDLRGLPEARCPECGTEFVRDATQVR